MHRPFSETVGSIQPTHSRHHLPPVYFCATFTPTCQAQWIYLWSFTQESFADKHLHFLHVMCFSGANKQKPDKKPTHRRRSGERAERAHTLLYMFICCCGGWATGISSVPLCLCGREPVRWRLSSCHTSSFSEIGTLIFHSRFAHTVECHKSLSPAGFYFFGQPKYLLYLLFSCTADPCNCLIYSTCWFSVTAETWEFKHKGKERRLCICCSGWLPVLTAVVCSGLFHCCTLKLLWFCKCSVW